VYLDNQGRNLSVDKEYYVDNQIIKLNIGTLLVVDDDGSSFDYNANQGIALPQHP